MCIEATLNQFYYLIYPFKKNNNIYTDSITEVIQNQGNASTTLLKLGIHDLDWMVKYKKIMNVYYEMCYAIPITGLLSHSSFYIILLFLITIKCLQKKMYVTLSCSALYYAILFIVLLGPVIQGHPRYIFPISYTFPIFILLFAYEKEQQNKKNIVNNSKNINIL